MKKTSLTNFIFQFFRNSVTNMKFTSLTFFNYYNLLNFLKIRLSVLLYIVKNLKFQKNKNLVEKQGFLSLYNIIKIWGEFQI